MAIVKEAEAGNEMDFSAQSQKWLGWEGRASRMQMEPPTGAPRGVVVSVPDLESNTCIWGQILHLPEEEGGSVSLLGKQGVWTR